MIISMEKLNCFTQNYSSDKFHFQMINVQASVIRYWLTDKSVSAANHQRNPHRPKNFVQRQERLFGSDICGDNDGEVVEKIGTIGDEWVNVFRKEIPFDVAVEFQQQSRRRLGTGTSNVLCGDKKVVAQIAGFDGLKVHNAERAKSGKH